MHLQSVCSQITFSATCRHSAGCSYSTGCYDSLLQASLAAEGNQVKLRIETRAPTRIDLAGGTLDIWPLYLFHPGATTLNAAIGLRAHARIESRTDGRLELI